MRRGAATILLFAGVLCLATALTIVLTGGFVVRGISLTLRDPIRPCVAGAVLLGIAWVVAGAAFPAIARPYVGARDRVPARIAALASGCALVFALAWTSRAAGGSDSSCYVLQAEAFARGQAALSSPIAPVLPDVPNAVFAPTGFLPSPGEYGRAVPICAPGLALLMAGAYAVHPGGVFLVVPICAALLVWLTFVYGRRLDGDVTALCAALLVACSPIVLYQAVQPMSDVPAAAAWMASLVLASRGDRAGAAGVCAGFAILIRPNLALLAVPLLFLKNRPVPFSPREKGDRSLFQETHDFPPIQPSSRKKGTGRFSAPEKGDRSLFLAAAVPGIATLVALNAVRYGSPLASGYGDTGTLFSLAHIGPNLPHYLVWMLETQTPVVLLAVAAPWVLRHDPGRLRLACVSLASVALLAITYLAYTVFDDWWYIRFLLPTLPILIALSVCVLRSLTQSLSATAGRWMLVTATATLGALYIHTALDRHVTDLQRLESGFALAGDYAARNLPANAVVLAVQESGSIRFHGRRDTVTWDAIPAAGLDALLERLRRSGRAPYLALEDAEEERFRQRFAGQRAGALDWRPNVELPAPRRVRFYEAPLAADR